MRSVALAVTVLALVLAAAAAPAPRPSPGRAVWDFARCGACHALRDAGSRGTFGPDLDRKRYTKAAVVRWVVKGGAHMPPLKQLLKPKQVDAVAAYVSSVAGRR